MLIIGMVISNLLIERTGPYTKVLLFELNITSEAPFFRSVNPAFVGVRCELVVWA